MDLFKYSGKVKIEFVDGSRPLTGTVFGYTAPGDSDDNVQELDLKDVDDPKLTGVINITEPEIKSVTQL
ncbi:hypothetical protein [Furfurilactobacillus rossiae]|uniref:Uncharacterized protein n=1 Tax=Furfurilactobacillus rossiae DSM 15814 TaxID=1114972 RepID=A0A0R1RJ42_9LACO|nr:hypothetical protein [Furfurilactobacillus rossiae]KRL56668.1 hypothetical protein FD35_GL001767 [Furfurilactobacillus rossiae DSM 15814]QFR66431.1 hypothetical protein LR814_04690 [Furfurilactobacillus rossiae]QLE61887.1 hypothetical protein LROSRS0_1842 [Furfurilactobacillus rossiae]